MSERICEFCKGSNKTPRSKWCSNLCNQRHRNKIKLDSRVKICAQCGCKHNRKKSIKYCSEKCMWRAFYNMQSKRKRDATRKKNDLPLNHPRLINEKGQGYYCSKRGYVYISKKGHPNARNKAGSIAEHTFIMSEYLGRPLTKKENVHHKNGVKDDNRIENLELWNRGQPPGQRVVDKIKWAREFLEEYGYEVNDTKGRSF